MNKEDLMVNLLTKLEKEYSDNLESISELYVHLKLFKLRNKQICRELSRITPFGLAEEDQIDLNNSSDSSASDSSDSDDSSDSNNSNNNYLDENEDNEALPASREASKRVLSRCRS